MFEMPNVRDVRAAHNHVYTHTHAWRALQAYLIEYVNNPTKKRSIELTGALSASEVRLLIETKGFIVKEVHDSQIVEW